MMFQLNFKLRDYSLVNGSPLFIIKFNGRENYTILDIRKDGDNYLILDSFVNTKLDEIEELKIFPQGKTRSVYENIYRIYSTRGFIDDYGDVYRFKSTRELNKYLLKRTGFTFEGLKSDCKVKYTARKVLYDINNGEVFITDNSNGITRLSVDFYQELSKIFNFKNAIKVEGFTNDKKDYIVNVYFENLIIRFGGFNAGYGGEGPRGFYNLLKTCGFNETECNNVFKANKILLVK